MSLDGLLFPVTLIFNSKKTSLEFLECLNDEQNNRFIETNLGKKKKSHRSRGRGQAALDNQMESLCGKRLVKGLCLFSGTEVSWQKTVHNLLSYSINFLTIQNKLHEITNEEWILSRENL